MEESQMGRYERLEKQYYEKFGEHILLMYVGGLPANKSIDDLLDEYEKCIKENKKFDEEAFFGKLDDDDII